MKTIDGKDIKLENVVLYNIVKEDNKHYIALLIEDENGELKNARTSYSESKIEELNKGMKQISKADKTKAGNIKVTYKDKKSLIFPPSREELINRTKHAQSIINKEKAVNDNWDNLSDKEKDTKQEKNKKARKAWLSAALIAGALGVGVGGTYLAQKFGLIDINKDADATTTPGFTDQMLTRDDVEEQPYVVMRTDRTYSFDVNNEEEVHKMGVKLCNEVKSKNMLLLTSGEIVKWDETVATSVVEMLNGITPRVFYGLDPSAKQVELEKIQTAIYLIIAENINTENKEVINLGDYVADSKERALFNNSLIVIGDVLEESGKEPINGAIIDTDEENTKFSRAYLNAVDQLLHYEIDTKNDPIYRELSAGSKWILMSMFDGTNAAYVPLWSYVERTSQPDIRDNEYPFIYYQNYNTMETWYAAKGPNAQVIFEEYKPGICEDGIAKSGKTKTQEEMEVYAESNVNIHKLGIDREVVLDEIKAAMESFENIVMNYTSTKSK